MKNTTICGNNSIVFNANEDTESIRREEHTAKQNCGKLPSTTKRSADHFNLNDELDYYILGFTTADGCIGWYPQRHDYYVQWSCKDLDILKLINSRVEGWIGKQKKYNDNHEHIYILRNTKKSFTIDMMSCGILPRKTENPQIINIDDKKMFSSYILGLIDGDGSWRYYYPNKNSSTYSLELQIRSYSKEFLQIIMNNCKKFYNVIGSITKDSSCYRLRYSTRAGLIIYDNLPIELMCNRKKNIIETFINLRGGLNNLKKKCRKCGDLFYKYRHNQLYCEKCYNKK